MIKGFQSIAIAVGLIVFSLPSLSDEKTSTAPKNEPVVSSEQGKAAPEIVQDSNETPSDLTDEPAAASKQPISISNSERSKNAQSLNPPEYLSALDGIESAIRDLIAEEDKIESERLRAQVDRDLNAQESMAKWAGVMAWLTGLTALLTAAALVFIWRTLYYTKEMLKEAEITTAAAVKTVKDTREIGQAQVRAYLVPDVVLEEPPRNERGRAATTEYKIVPQLFNCGQSPVLALQFITTVEDLNEYTPLEHNFVGSSGLHVGATSTELLSTDESNVIEGWRTQKIEDHHSLILVTKYQFEDVFGRVFRGRLTWDMSMNPRPQGAATDWIYTPLESEEWMIPPNPD